MHIDRWSDSHIDRLTEWLDSETAAMSESTQRAMGGERKIYIYMLTGA